MSTTIDQVIGTSSLSGTKTGTSWSYSHTVAGTSPILVVAINVIDLTTPPTSSAITGVTYNGVALSNIGSISNTLNAFASLWYLLNPTTGANTLAVTADAAYVAQSATSVNLLLRNTSSQPDNSQTITATAQNPTNTITPNTGDTVVFDTIAIPGSVTLTGPNSTQTALLSAATGSSAWGVSYYKKVISAKDAVPMGWVTSASKAYAQVIASFTALGGTRSNIPAPQKLRPHPFSPGLAR